MNTLRIATRKSQLALWQARYVKQLLLQHYANLNVELVPLVSEGDQKLDTALSKIGGKGLFTKALEDALLQRKADIAVHSLKDMPAMLPQGLKIGAICQRDDPRDVLLSRKALSHTDDIPPQAVVGTSSLRRQSQLQAKRPDLQFKLLRGNINSRIEKLKQGDYDVIILASAGLKRLGIKDPEPLPLPTDWMIPSPGQGAICIECLSDDTHIHALINPLNHVPTEQCTLAERSMNERLGGSCQVPIAGYASIVDHQLILNAMVATPDGRHLLKTTQKGSPSKARTIGINAANALLEQGARAILKAVL